MDVPKQDRNGVRTPVDLERRYQFGNIASQEERLKKVEEEQGIDNELSLFSNRAVANKIITKKFNELDLAKVEKEYGKGLSTNDFTDDDKNSIHSHKNKTILDTITQEDIDNWNKEPEPPTIPDAFLIGSVFFTTLDSDPSTILGYGVWQKINTQELSSVTIYSWLRTS